MIRSSSARIMDLPVLVISLTSAQQRRQSIVQQMHLHSIPFEFLDAVDSKSILTHPYVANAMGEHAVRLKSGTVVARAELACAISHHLALKHIVSCGARGGIILEDDAIVQPTFSAFRAELSARDDWATRNAVIHCAANFPGDGDGLVVGQRSAVELPCGVSLLRVRRFSAPLWGAVGYFVTAKAAAALLTRNPDRADAWRWFLKERFLEQIWLARPAPILHPTDERTLPSQISPDRMASINVLRHGWGLRQRRRLSRYLGIAFQFAARFTLDPVIKRMG